MHKHILNRAPRCCAPPQAFGDFARLLGFSGPDAVEKLLSSVAPATLKLVGAVGFRGALLGAARERAACVMCYSTVQHMCRGPRWDFWTPGARPSSADFHAKHARNLQMRC